MLSLVITWLEQWLDSKNMSVFAIILHAKITYKPLSNYNAHPFANATNCVGVAFERIREWNELTNFGTAGLHAISTVFTLSLTILHSKTSDVP